MSEPNEPLLREIKPGSSPQRMVIEVTVKLLNRYPTRPDGEVSRSSASFELTEASRMAVVEKKVDATAKLALDGAVEAAREKRP